MILKGSQITLRALENSDLDFLYQLENDSDYWHLGSVVSPFSKHVLSQYLENAHLDIYTAKQLRLIIDYKGVPAGTIDLYDFDPVNLRAGVGIIVLEAYRKKGIAREALDLIKVYCKSKLNMHQLYATILISNKESIKLFENSGFMRCGHRKDWIFRSGLFEDVYEYQLIL